MGAPAKKQDGRNRQNRHCGQGHEGAATPTLWALRSNDCWQILKWQMLGLSDRRNGQAVAWEGMPRSNAGCDGGCGFRPSDATVGVQKRHVGDETIPAFGEGLYISRIVRRVP